MKDPPTPSLARWTKQITPSRLSPLFKWYQDSWVLDCLSLALSIVCLIAIFTLLLHFDDKASTTWHLKVGINAVLSVVATALNGAVLVAAASALGQLKWAWYHRSARSLQDFQTFDSASRGPIGAFLLLLRLPYSALACLGSLTMIIALASDASIQASTSQPLRSRFSRDASVPVGQNFQQHTSGLIIDPLLLNALHTGVTNSEVLITNNMATTFNPGNPGRLLNTMSNTILPSCSTGNCKFEPYASLAIQHRCLDMTEFLQYDHGSNPSFQSVTLPISPTLLPFDSATEVQDLRASYSTSSLSEQARYTVLNMTSPARNMSVIPPMASRNNSPYTTDSLPFAEVSMIFLNGSSVDASTKASFRAFRCNLDFGIRFYTGSVTHGVFTETPGNFIRGNWTLELESDNQATHDGLYFGNIRHWSLKTNVSGTERQAKIGWDIWLGIARNMRGFFTDVVDTVSNSGSDFSSIIEASEYFTTSIGVEAVFDEIAQSLTKYFRTASDEAVMGTTESLEQYIHVDWKWLIVPLVLVVLNTSFVSAVRLQSYRLALPSWRNSALALMLRETTLEEATGKIQQDKVLIGPADSVECISDLEIWAETRLATLRGAGTGE